MWIKESFIERFGGFSQFALGSLVPGINVVVGPNEAGKSTMMEFIRSVFFGFKKKTPKIENTYEAPNGSLRRGWLIVHTPQGKVLRLERAEQPRRKEGILTITDEQGAVLTEQFLPIFGLGMERGLFETLFAFDLETMRRLDTDSLRGKIVGTALGSVDVNPLEVLRQVNQRCAALEKKSAKDETSFYGISARLGEVSQELRGLKERPRRYGELKEELDRLNVRREGIADQVRQTESELERINLLLGKEWECKKLCAIDLQIQALADVKDFPVNGEPELDRLLEKRAGLQEDQKEVVFELGKLKERLERTSPDEVLLTHSHAIRAFGRQAQRLMTRPADIEKLRAEIEAGRGNLAAAIEELGRGWDLDRVTASDPSVVLDETISRFADSWKAAREVNRDLQRTVSTVEDGCRRLQEKIALRNQALAELAPSCEGFLTVEHRNRLAEWKDHSSTAAHLRDRLSDKNAAQERLAQENERIRESSCALDSERGRELSWAVVYLLAALSACVGFGMLVLATSDAGMNPGGFLLAGLVLVATGPLFIEWNAHEERRTQALVQTRKESLAEKMGEVSTEMETIAREQSAIVSSIHKADARMREIAAALLGDPAADREAILAAEARSIAAEEPVRRKRSLEEALISARQDLDAERRRQAGFENELVRARERLDTLRAEWQEFLEEKGLDPEMDPETTRELVRRLAVLKKEQRAITEREKTLGPMVQDWEEFVGKVQALGLTMERPADPDVSALDVVAHWVQAEQEARDVEASRKVLADKIEEQEARLLRERERSRQTELDLADLLRRGGASDEGSFRERAGRFAEYQVLVKERRGLVDTLVAGLRCSDEATMRSRIQDQKWDENHAIAERLQTDLERLRRESEELAEQIGSLGREISMLETEEKVEAILAEKERLIACEKEKAREWIVLRLASTLLDRTIRFYESQKQPRVMERCSALFQAMTGGAFRAVRIPMDGTGIKAERADGRTVEQAVLSRGTMEQLYLCLRLAHLDIYHRDESAVPLVMDDVLVNFDRDRAARTAHILSEFAIRTGTQVLFFTCHPHTADLFPGDVHRVELSQIE